MSHSLSETNTVFINKIFKKLQQNEIDNVDFFCYTLFHIYIAKVDIQGFNNERNTGAGY